MELTIENLFVTISKQGKRFVAFSPALDISTTGKTKAEARKRFALLVPLFFEEMDAAGTTDVVLAELGWQRKGVRSPWMPPAFSPEQMKVRVPCAA